MEEVITAVKTFFTYVIWGVTFMTMVFPPLKISSPSLMVQASQQWEGEYVMSENDTPSACIFVNGTDTKTSSLLILCEQII